MRVASGVGKGALDGEKRAALRGTSLSNDRDSTAPHSNRVVGGAAHGDRPFRVCGVCCNHWLYRGRDGNWLTRPTNRILAICH